MGGVAGGRAEAWREGVMVAAILVAATIFVMGFWVPLNWPTALSRAEALWGIPVPQFGRWFSGWAFGDGQAFAVIATDPFGQGAGATLGWPGYRYMRVGFGWVVGMVSLGNPTLVPYAITFVGLGSLVALFVLAVRLRPEYGAQVWLLCLNPAVFVAIAGGTAESLGLFLLAMSLVTRRWWWAAALGTVRPTYFVSLVREPRLLLVGLATAVAVALLAALRFGWDLSQYAGATTWPLLGYIEGADPASWLAAWCALVTIAIGIRRKDVAWVLAGLFVLCFSVEVVDDFRNTWRGAGMLPVLWVLGGRADSESPMVTVLDLTDRVTDSVTSRSLRRTLVD